MEIKTAPWKCVARERHYVFLRIWYLYLKKYSTDKITHHYIVHRASISISFVKHSQTLVIHLLHDITIKLCSNN